MNKEWGKLIKKMENGQAPLIKCPKCGTTLIIKHKELIRDYCPKCKDILVYVIDTKTKTGKGKTMFFKDLIKENIERKRKKNAKKNNIRWSN